MKHFLFICTLAFLFINSAYAQTAEITGTVRDTDTKDPLNGASVKIDKGKGSITDASGKFHISVPAGDVKITITFIGYKNYKDTLTLQAGDKKILEIDLMPSAIQVNQVYAVSQYRKNAAKETVSTEVVSKTQIKNTNSNDLGEVVNKTPGVLVQDGQISIRGGSSYSYGVGSRTAVLTDGLSMSSADLGEGQNKMVPLSNVKQVEVIKGASSVVYGSSALNGVVNVVTEWPQDAEPKTEIEINYGVYNAPPKGVNKYYGDGLLPMFGIINFNHQQRIKQLQVVAAANITRNDGYLENSDEMRMQGLFKLRYLHPKIEGLNFGVGGSIMQESSNRFFIAKDLQANALLIASGSTDNYLRSTIDPFVSYHSPKGHRFTSNMRYMNIFRKGNGEDPNAVSHQLIADNQYQYKWKNAVVLTAGIPFTVGASSSNLYPGQRINFNTAVYAQLEYNYKFLSVQGGLRYEVAGVDTQIVSSIPVFRSGINLQAAKATFFRASWGQGYRIPSIGEKYVAQPFFNGLLIVPNDTLKSERGWSLELGFKQGFKIKNWQAYFDAAFFWQQYQNFIEFQINTWPNYYSNGQKIFPDSMEFGYPTFNFNHQVLGLKALNIENARIAGYELGIAGTGKIGPVGVSILAGYTYTWPGKAEGDSTYKFGEFLKDMFKYNFQRVGADDTSKLLYYRIRHLVRADIELTYWKVYLGGTFNYGSMPEKIPGLFQVAANLLFGDIHAVEKYQQNHIHGDFFMDLRAGINITEHFKFGFIVKNVTNRLYSLRPGKPEPLRSFTFQLKYTF